MNETPAPPAAPAGPDAAAPKPDTERLGGRAVRGAAWLSAGQLARQAFSFGTSLILARLLVPDDFGLFGMTYVAAEIAQVFISFGLGAAIVQRQVSAPEVLTTCFWFNVAIGLAAGLGLALSGPMLADYYSRPEIQQLVWPLAVNMLVAGAMVVPQAILTQQLRFRDITLAQIVGSVLGSVTALLLAWAGVGVWALAAQPLIGNLLTGVWLMRSSRWLPGLKPALRHLQGLFSLSVNLLGSNLITAVGRNLHTFVIGRYLGAAPLGAFTMASALTGTVIYQITSVVTRVLFPTLSRLTEQPMRLADTWLTANAVVGLTTIPIMAGAAAVAPDVVHVLLGPQWTDAETVLPLLCVAMAVQSPLMSAGTVLLTFGRGDLLLTTSVITAVLSGIGYWAGTAYGGLEGAAWGYLGMIVITHLWTAWLGCRLAKIPLWRLLMPLVLPTACSLGMALLMMITAHYLRDANPLARLSVCVVVGAATYVALAMAFGRSTILPLITRVKHHWSDR
ncbi:lipopolysaccharide biosynthesis protein [Aquincola tertiaricarbonis]|uniref:Lipopolysaccharide biosynthesis protein n=1 Tax=Aquincola tertiaricarbonis TaxID=391953 RepID=A0A1S6R6I1_AQUTE|nr:lipopolysaccharide biosynthesis protein [Aquincola tertiaricarbonis]AQW45596.1 lipopolysaccharide biosynthesis protein WzxC [Aquincola tertiaricarbonis]URI10258.1 lipopolysaccharide biosynthesis protein [Aquincola tertiaricarbonis]